MIIELKNQEHRDIADTILKMLADQQLTAQDAFSIASNVLQRIEESVQSVWEKPMQLAHE